MYVYVSNFVYRNRTTFYFFKVVRMVYFANQFIFICRTHIEEVFSQC